MEPKTRKWLPFEKYKEVCGLVPRLCVDVIVKSERGIWLTHRAIEPYKGMWHIPGGSVLYGETLEEAVLRVAKEELGFVVEVVRLVGPMYYPGEGERRGYPSWPVSSAHEVRQVGGELSLDTQADDAREFMKLPDNLIEEQKIWLINNGFG